MITPIISAYVIPTGGAVGLTLTTAVSGAVTLSRATSGASGLSAWTQLYSGGPLRDDGLAAFYLDVGDQLNQPLDATQLYVYQLMDVNGTADTGALSPVATLKLIPDQLDWILYRLIQAGISNLMPPAGVKVATVSQAMPLNQPPPLPFVVINPDLLQQDSQAIGEDVQNPGNLDNTWTISELAKRVYRVSVLSSSQVERDYYRDAIIGIFKVALAYALAPLGENVTHRYQANSYQNSDEIRGMSPGFYGCDVLLEITGTFNIAITTSYGVIGTINVNMIAAGDPEDVAITATVPVSG